MIVVDDPISSLDEHRRNATRDAILDLADRAKQTIVFSHSPRFLASLSEAFDQDSDSCLLRISKTGNKTSELTDWSEDGLRRKIEDPSFAASSLFSTNGREILQMSLIPSDSSLRAISVAVFPTSTVKRMVRWALLLAL